MACQTLTVYQAIVLVMIIVSLFASHHLLPHVPLLFNQKRSALGPHILTLEFAYGLGWTLCHRMIGRWQYDFLLNIPARHVGSEALAGIICSRLLCK
jgi:hypothetical protein